MTTVAVLADPPREGLVLPTLSETSPLDESEISDLYAAMLKDTFRAVASSGGELLVNYRPEDLLPEAFRGEKSPEAEIRALARTALDDLDDVRFEVQVGSSFDSRAGNTATHLLEREEVKSVALLRGTTPFLTRKEIDGAAMKLRNNETVIGPAEGGRIYYLGLTAPIDFEGVHTLPELETVTNHAADAGHDIDFMPALTRVETGSDLVSVVSAINARRAAGRVVPMHTAAFVEEVGLRVVDVGGEPTLDRA